MKGQFSVNPDGRVALSVKLSKKEAAVGKNFINGIEEFNKKERMQFSGQGTVRIKGIGVVNGMLDEFTIEEPFLYKEKQPALYTLRERLRILFKGSL